MRRVLLATLILCGACATAPRAQPVRVDPDTLRSVAIGVLQGHTSEPFLRAEDIAVAAEAIAALRQQFPELADIAPFPLTPLQLHMTDSAWARLMDLHPAAAGDTLPARTGWAALDSLNAVLGARVVREPPHWLKTLTVQFTRPANVPALARVYGRLPGVLHAGPRQYLGESNNMRVRLRGDTVALGLSRGWGDCMSGCLYHRGFTLVYHRSTGRVVLVSDSGDPTPLAGFDTWKVRRDWAAFDRLPEDQRRAYARALAGDPRTSLRDIARLTPRLDERDFEAIGTIVERADIRRAPGVLADLALLPRDAGRHARKILYDAYGLSLVRDHRTSPAVVRALVDEYATRKPPPLAIGHALLQNRHVLADRSLLGRVLRESAPAPELYRAACDAFLARYPAWEYRTYANDPTKGLWMQTVPCPDVPPAPASRP